MSLWTSTTKRNEKIFSMGESTSVQGQIYHATARRKVRVPPLLTRLSDKEMKKWGLSIFETYTPN